MRVVGAGLGRTGTMSLKLALEKLLDGPCYHMLEVFPRPDHIAMWQDVLNGERPDWDRIFEGFAAAVDWPVAAFWREISNVYPEAIILLSTRAADSWWQSADRNDPRRCLPAIPRPGRRSLEGDGHEAVREVVYA